MEVERERRTERGIRAKRSIVKILAKDDQAERASIAGRLKSKRKRGFESRDREKKDYMREHLRGRQSRLRFHSCTVIRI